MKVSFIIVQNFYKVNITLLKFENISFFDKTEKIKKGLEIQKKSVFTCIFNYKMF